MYKQKMYIFETLNLNLDPSSGQEDIVITGISGRFPESENIEELKKNLYSGIDLVTEDERRWPSGTYGLPKRSGKLKTLSKFDSLFFGVNTKQANTMDPQLRILLEVTHEAIVDAGLNPNDLKGTKTGVFIGVSETESYEFFRSDPTNIKDIGTLRTFLANRISFSFDFNGPSYCIDSGCSSSLVALQNAVMAIKGNQCDAAIVGGSSLTLNPANSLQYFRGGMLDFEGCCKPFDALARGFARSEGIAIIFLQRKPAARRIYATVLGVGTNADGSKIEGFTYPSREKQAQLLRGLYKEKEINPLDVSYVEAHGTGTSVGDPEEANSIANVFCEGRETPLLIGSLKSNMGHAEAAAGVCSIVKVLLSMEEDLIPATLHHQTPNPNIQPLVGNKLKVVVENTPWYGGIMGVCSYGIGGSNAHCILKSNQIVKSKNLNKIPRIIGVSGRTPEAVSSLLNHIENNKEDTDLLALIHEIHKKGINHHFHRGFVYLNTIPLRELSKVNDGPRPIWFIYSGMGSQWPSMGRSLLQIKICKTSITKSAEYLKPLGIDLEDILTNESESTLKNMVNVLVGIVSVQIALTDLLVFLGIEPSGFIGHSLGEISCAYADGAFTHQETILAAYARGYNFLGNCDLPCAMASVGLPWNDARIQCPEGVFPVCNNSSDNVTIAGPLGLVQSFVEELKSKGVFTREIDSAKFAFHTKYIADKGPPYQKALEEIIPNPRARSTRWISTSIPEEEWGSTLAQSSSPEYHTNNMISPVFFYEALQHVPDDAICVEVAPTGLFQSILRRTMKDSVTNISLVKKGHPDNLEFLLTSLGKLYNAGAQPRLEKLYNPVTFPVGKGTPNISSHIKWDHSVDWKVPKFDPKGTTRSENTFKVNLNKESDVYLTGHNVNGHILYPAAGYLVLVWKTLAKLHNTNFEELPVVFENINFTRATSLSKEHPTKFSVNIYESSTKFEIWESDSVVVTGRIRVSEKEKKVETEEEQEIKTEENKIEEVPVFDGNQNIVTTQELKKSEIYAGLKLRGYDFQDHFCSISSSDLSFTKGVLKWNNNWVTYLDSVLQFSFLSEENLRVPTKIQKLFINPKQHVARSDYISISICKNTNILKSGCVELTGYHSSVIERRETQKPPLLQKYVFIPYEDTTKRSTTEVLTILLGIILENTSTLTLKVAEVNTSFLENFLVLKMKEIIEKEHKVVFDGTIVAMDIFTELPDDIKLERILNDKQNLIVFAGAPDQELLLLLKNHLSNLKENGFFLLETTKKPDLKKIKSYGLVPIATQLTQLKQYTLLRLPVEVLLDSTIINISRKNFNWLVPLQSAIEKSETHGTKIYLYEETEANGLTGMANCLKLEPGGTEVRTLSGTKPFTISGYLDQLQKDLFHNVLKDKTWGSFRYLPLKHEDKQSVKNAYVNIEKIGDLASLQWIEAPRNSKSTNPELELCQIHYSALNFRDLFIALGRLSDDAVPKATFNRKCVLGFEFSGVNSKNQRVMGMTHGKSIATSVLADSSFLCEVPDEWSLAEAATVPVAYATVYYALILRAHLQPGETILIHSGAGGVGQAAISIALSMNCKVYTTVGTDHKREFLKEAFPQLTDDCIGNSRDPSFESFIQKQTKDRGVDVVLNSLSKELLQASLRCLASGGRFLELGKEDAVNNSLSLGIKFLVNNINFYGISLDFVDVEIKNQIMSLLTEGIRNGVVKPIVSTIFSKDQVEEAFRHMANGNHIGKIVIKIQDQETQTMGIVSVPRSYFYSDKTYIFIGGLGGMGLEVIKWCVQREATKIVINSRSGITTGYQSLCIRRLEDKGVKILVTSDDVTTPKGAENLLVTSRKLGPIGGIFNLALILRDGMITNQTEEDFTTVCKPKLEATRNLDVASRLHASDLDYFVCFSSLASGHGNFGQSNYGFGSSAMERICQQRQKDNLPGLAIQWGAVDDVGYLARNQDINIKGYLPQRMSSCLTTLDILLQKSDSVVSSFVIDKTNKENGFESKDGIVERIAHIFGFDDISVVPESLSFHELGLDSLMGTEIKQALESYFDVVWKIEKVRCLSFGQLKKLDAEKFSS